MRWKRSLAVSLSVLVSMSVSACGQKKEEPVQEKASVYIQCYSEEAGKVWSGIAGTYRKEHGVNIRVLAPDEIAKEDGQPTIAVLEEPSEYENWRDHCMDLADTRMYSWLLDKEMVLKEKKSVSAVPCGIRGLGIVYNEEMAERYFAFSGRNTKFESMDDIQNFEDLKEVVEDMTSNKRQLGYQGVFASPYLAYGENGWQPELLGLAVSMEQQEKGNPVALPPEFIFSDSVRNIVDLYFDNSCTGKKSLWRKTEEDALGEFAEGRAVMIQGNDQIFQKISEITENVVSPKEIRYLPLYLGTSKQKGICIEAEDYLCINDEASDSNKKAAVTFLEWLYETDQGKEYVTEEMGYIAPYVTFSEEDIPTDPLALEMIIAVEDQEINFANWNIGETSGIDQDILRHNLSEYADTLKTWDEVSGSIKEELSDRKSE